MKTKNIVIVVIVVLAVIAAVLFWWPRNQPQVAQAPVVTPPAGQSSSTILYTNDQYGFTFTLPVSWQGYSIATTTWTGNETCASGNCPQEKGPEIMIRNPQWTAANNWQPIPIMVFTPAEWTAVASGTLAIGAAPIPPSELGSNSNYVFALPARYNYAFPEGYQEVETIMAGNPLQGF